MSQEPIKLIAELKTRFAVGFISVIRPGDKHDKWEILINGEKRDIIDIIETLWGNSENKNVKSVLTAYLQTEWLKEVEDNMQR